MTTIDALADDQFPDHDEQEGAIGEAEAAARLAAEWNSSLKPFDSFEVRLVDDIALQSVRIDRCRQQQRDLRAQRAHRAARRWDDDRRDEAEALGATLAKSPALVARQLRRTRQGCDWIIARWGRLLAALDDVGDWDPAQLRLAFDLLGVPAEFREGPTPLAIDRAGRASLVRVQVETIEREKSEVLDEIERDERSRAVKGDGPDEGGELAALLRREQMFACRFEWSKDQLKKGRHAHPTLNGPGGGRPPIVSPTAPPAPPRCPERTEEEWRQVTQARAAIKSAQQAPNPPKESVEGGLPTLVLSQPQALADEPPGPPPEESPEAIVARMSPEEHREAIRDHPDFRSLSPSGRIHALLTGDPSGRAPNRRERRALRARNRRNG